MPLRPDRTIIKILISSTSRFVGEYASKLFLITHSWNQRYDRASDLAQTRENPYCRNYFVVAFNIGAPDPVNGYCYNSVSLGEIICSYLSILFGKRFDNHGVIEENGLFSTPDLQLGSPVSYVEIGLNNHKPRKDLEIELKLNQIKLIEPLLNSLIQKNDLDIRFQNTLNSAGKFYLNSIRVFEKDPEIAFLHLVSCGEVLANYYEYAYEELFSKEDRDIFTEIQKKCDKGESICNNIKKRLIQIRRRYRLTISGYSAVKKQSDRLD
jgi:hypothetical protein